MYGVGEKTAPQLLTEISNVHRFPRRSFIVGFADINPAVDDSGKHISKNYPTTKHEPPHLRKTPIDELVYRFQDKNTLRASSILST